MSDDARRKAIEAFASMEPRYSDVDPILDDSYTPPPLDKENATQEEVIAWYADVKTHSPNLITREFAAGMHAILESSLSTQLASTSAEMEEIRKNFRISIDAMFARLEAIPEDVWSKWCAVPKERFIKDARAIHTTSFMYTGKDKAQ